MALSKEERDVADELHSILKTSGADVAYDLVPGSMGGRVLNADLARELSPRYRTLPDRIKFTTATYEPARDYVYDRFMRKVVELRGRGVVVLLAGGAASGKSTSIMSRLSRAALIFDGNCAQFDKACRMIDAAASSGLAVLVVYMHRNFPAAVEGMLTRAIKEGRHIALFGEDGQTLAALHFNAQQVFIKLEAHFADSKRIQFAALRNPWTPGNPASPTTIAIKTLAPGGKRCYTSVKELYEIQNQVVSRFIQAGTLSESLRAALGLP